MNTAEEFAARARAIVEPYQEGTQLHIEFATVAEARLAETKLLQLEYELGLIKRDITWVKEDLATAFAHEEAKVGTSFGAGLAMGIFGRRTVGVFNDAHRSGLRQRQLEMIAPYEAVARAIDHYLAAIGSLKIQVNAWVANALAEAEKE